VPAEKFRNARIVLLKITHIPIVCAIWVFESAHDQVKGGAPTFSYINPSTQLSSDSSTPAKKQRPFLINRTHKKASSQHFEDNTSHDELVILGPQIYTIKGRKEDKGKHVVVDQSGLEEKVADLSSKVEELTALIMAQ